MKGTQPLTRRLPGRSRLTSHDVCVSLTGPALLRNLRGPFLSGSFAWPGALHDLGRDPFFELGQRSDLMSANIAADDCLVLIPFANVEAVLTALGTVEFDTHATRLLYAWRKAKHGGF